MTNMLYKYINSVPIARGKFIFYYLFSFQSIKMTRLLTYTKN